MPSTMQAFCTMACAWSLLKTHVVPRHLRLSAPVGFLICDGCEERHDGSLASRALYNAPSCKQIRLSLFSYSVANTCMVLPGLEEDKLKNFSGRFKNLASQSNTTTSSSVHAGDAIQSNPITFKPAQRSSPVHCQLCRRIYTKLYLPNTAGYDK